MDERERLEALSGLHIVGTSPEPEFDGIAALAARLADTRWAAVTFVDDEREWVKAAHGAELDHVGRRTSFGGHIVERNGPILAEDASTMPALQPNPWISAGVRFYAGVPLAVGGLPIGTLAVLDPDPRPAGDDLLDALNEAGSVLMPHLQRRRDDAMAENLTALFDLEARFRRVSVSFERLLGWSRDEMIGRELVEFVHPDDVALERDRIGEILEGRRMAAGESRFRTRDGRYRWIYWTTQLSPHEGVYYSTGKDITDRKRNEIALRESEARYRLLAENATDLVTGHDLDGTLTYVSNAGRALTGWHPDELVGRNQYEFVHPEDRERVETAHRQLLEGAEEVRIPARIRRKDGSWLWVEAISRLVRDRDSKPTGLQTATRDISETRAAVEALDAAREHFQRIFDDAPIGMAIVNPDHTFHLVNASFCRFVGYTREELLAGAGPPDLIHPDDLHDIGSLLRDLLATGRSFNTEKRHIRKDGGIVWLRVTASLLRDERDGERRLLASVEDVTEQRQTADELRRAREEAERANRAKSEFLSRMSHELRTPLNAVLGFAQLLESDELAAGQRESVARIMRGGYHLLNLVNDVLDMSAVESGQLPIPIELVSVSDTITDTVELMRPLADERSIRLTADMPRTTIDVCANEQRLKQVLLNLTSNAIKYSATGADVTVRADRENGTHARIHVIDTGPGIPEDQLERAFLPFERLGASHKTEGTGLGLALSRSLVQGMGGTLSVESTPAGSTFTVVLPIAGDCEGEECRPATSVETKPEDHARVRRILYIEDNEANVAVVERLCQRRGDCELHAAPRGDSGIELARRLQPDAVILDLHLPDTTADDVLRVLRADDALSDTPVIVVTADVTQDHEQRLRAAGASAYLTKPLDLGRLQDEIDRALGGRRT